MPWSTARTTSGTAQADSAEKARASVKLRAGQVQITELPGFYIRVVEYKVPDRGDDAGELITLVTNITDPDDLNAADLAISYHEQWEVELAIGEIKTHQRGGAIVLRSRKPELVKQEIWGLLITHYAIRHLMCEAADQADRDPDRISFIRSLRVARRQVTGQAAFPPHRLVQKIIETIEEIVERTNPERRQRSCPRAMKRVRHNSYRAKRRTDKNVSHGSPPTIQLIHPAA